MSDQRTHVPVPIPDVDEGQDDADGCRSGVCYDREDCGCYGEDDYCTFCGGSGERVPDHCCDCGGGVYDCTCCGQCGGSVETCSCPLTVQRADGSTLTV
ncbi:hypothetical protein [Streptacidiphilus rugosus]|uniref:hypothetical protein n=1 Tax=Streptacidiphilus rugosus TaxID=405783 RepID=UPI00055AF04F|nr:hypothetical protein [Streptacidiphilus rugosus]